MKKSTHKNISSMMLWIFLLSLLLVWGVMAQDEKMDEEITDSSFPNVMTYEGYITDSDGMPLSDGQYDFTFAIYSTPIGGSPIWIEEHKSVYAKDGFIQLYLGRGTVPDPIILPFDRPYYLGISIGDTPELSPRVELTPTAYSFRANIANNVPDASITTRNLAPLSVTDEKIKSVSWSKITDAPNLNDPAGDGDPGVPANSWLLKGNRRSDPPEDFLGTTDEIDLIFKTHNEQRVKIDKKGFTNVLDTTQSTDSSNGALVVDGGAGIAKNLNVGGKGKFGELEVKNNLTVWGNLGVGTMAPADFKMHVKGEGTFVGNHVALFENTSSSSGDGIAIKINSTEPDNENNFVSFLDNSNNVVGRIEGQDASDFHSSFEFEYTTAFAAADIALFAAEAAACGGQWDFGELAVNIGGVAKMAAQYAWWLGYMEDNLGVYFTSGSGDYAEYLERANVEERIEAGDIVGVIAGKISKSTRSAQQLMVVSSTPIVLGNMPRESELQLYEKVAFLGQVLVKVIGPVKKGDYIIPSGLEDGTGIAVSTEMMTIDEFFKVVGRAWSSSGESSVKLINVAVGVNSIDISTIIKKQMSEQQQLRSELQATLEQFRQTQSELNALKEAMVNLVKLEQTVKRVQEVLDNTDSKTDSNTKLVISTN